MRMPAPLMIRPFTSISFLIITTNSLGVLAHQYLAGDRPARTIVDHHRLTRAAGEVRPDQARGEIPGTADARCNQAYRPHGEIRCRCGVPRAITVIHAPMTRMTAANAGIAFNTCTRAHKRGAGSGEAANLSL